MYIHNFEKIIVDKWFHVKKSLLQQQQQQQQQATPVAVNHQQMQAQPQQTLSVQAGQVAGASPQVIQLQPVSSVVSRKKIVKFSCLFISDKYYY